MKKLPLLIFAILLTTTFLFACVGTEEAPFSAERLADTLHTAFVAQDSVYVTGTVTEGEAVTRLSGTVDSKNNAIRLRKNDVEYFYYAKTLFCDSGNGFEVVETGTSFVTFLKQLPFSAFYFVYDENDCEKGYATKEHLVVTFGGAGVKRCFDSDKNVSGGVYTVSYRGEATLSTYLTTTLHTAQGDVSYSATYSYSPADAVDTAVSVRPTDGNAYASFASAKLADGNGQKTLRLSDTGKNTGVTLDAILPLSQSQYITMSDVESAFVIDSNEYVTLNIAYKSAKTVIGLSSSAREIAVTYQKSDYAVTLVVVNSGLRYVLE